MSWGQPEELNTADPVSAPAAEEGNGDANVAADSQPEVSGWNQADNAAEAAPADASENNPASGEEWGAQPSGWGKTSAPAVESSTSWADSPVEDSGSGAPRGRGGFGGRGRGRGGFGGGDDDGGSRGGFGGRGRGRGRGGFGGGDDDGGSRGGFGGRGRGRGGFGGDDDGGFRGGFGGRGRGRGGFGGGDDDGGFRGGFGGRGRGRGGFGGDDDGGSRGGFGGRGRGRGGRTEPNLNDFNFEASAEEKAERSSWDTNGNGNVDEWISSSQPVPAQPEVTAQSAPAAQPVVQAAPAPAPASAPVAQYAYPQPMDPYQQFAYQQYPQPFVPSSAMFAPGTTNVLLPPSAVPAGPAPANGQPTVVFIPVLLNQGSPAAPGGYVSAQMPSSIMPGLGLYPK